MGTKSPNTFTASLSDRTAKRVLHSRTEFEREQALLISSDHKSGEIVELAQQLADIDRQLAEVGDVTEKHHHLRSERERLTHEIKHAERRRSTLEDNLRGYRYLERIHSPWSRERKLRQDQSALRLVGSIPDDGLTRYDRFVRDINGHKRKRSELLTEAKRLYQEAGEHSGDTSLLQHECTIRRLADERDDVKQRERRLAEKQAKADKLKRQLDSHNSKIGGRSDTQIQTLDLGRLLKAALNYQKALSKKGRAVGRYKKLVSNSQKRKAEFNDRHNGLGGLALSNAIKSTRRQMTDLEELHQLGIDEARLVGQMQAPKQTRSLANQSQSVLNFRDLPPLFYLIMWFFTGAGMCLFFCGLWWAATYDNIIGHTAWIVGAIYSCFGLCMAGVTWTVRQHFEQFFEGGLTDGHPLPAQGPGRRRTSGGPRDRPAIGTRPQNDHRAGRAKHAGRTQTVVPGRR